jgi:hypothetical protein
MGSPNFWKVLPTVGLILAACASGKQYPTGTQSGARTAAMTCSLVKSREYAKNSQEPADLVAKAGFNACYGLPPYHSVRRVFPSTAGRLAYQARPSRRVDTLVKTECRDTGICDPVFEGQMRQVYERSRISSETPDVIKVRSKR